MLFVKSSAVFLFAVFIGEVPCFRRPSMCVNAVRQSLAPFLGCCGVQRTGTPTFYTSDPTSPWRASLQFRLRCPNSALRRFGSNTLLVRSRRSAALRSYDITFRISGSCQVDETFIPSRSFSFYQKGRSLSFGSFP